MSNKKEYKEKKQKFNHKDVGGEIPPTDDEKKVDVGGELPPTDDEK